MTASGQGKARSPQVRQSSLSVDKMIKRPVICIIFAGLEEVYIETNETERVEKWGVGYRL